MRGVDPPICDRAKTSKRKNDGKNGRRKQVIRERGGSVTSEEGNGKGEEES